MFYLIDSIILLKTDLYINDFAPKIILSSSDKGSLLELQPDLIKYHATDYFDLVGSSKKFKDDVSFIRHIIEIAEIDETPHQCFEIICDKLSYAKMFIVWTKLFYPHMNCEQCFDLYQSVLHDEFVYTFYRNTSSNSVADFVNQTFDYELNCEKFGELFDQQIMGDTASLMNIELYKPIPFVFKDILEDEQCDKYNNEIYISQLSEYARGACSALFEYHQRYVQMRGQVGSYKDVFGENTLDNPDNLEQLKKYVNPNSYKDLEELYNLIYNVTSYNDTVIAIRNFLDTNGYHPLFDWGDVCGSLCYKLFK